MLIYRGNFFCSAGGKLQADIAAAAEKIQYTAFFKIKIINKDIEQALLTTVCSRADWQVAGSADHVPFFGAADYTHTGKLKDLLYKCSGRAVSGKLYLN